MPGNPGDKDRTKAIEELAKQVEKLKDWQDKFEDRPKAPAPPGPPGKNGPPGPPGTVDYTKVSELIERALRQKSFRVVFEAGDESTEPERTVIVKLNGGELRIPATMMRIRNVNVAGQQVGPPLTDVAPLGQPLKFRFVPPIEAK